ncbi:helix-turn-helix domain-containing protein [Apilactobacillus micheneri]|uniref:helix-turn-helix domain-containing protein n=1 Tax=Apilactobacillus micheneri TaxID=1899430 RepID=UPI000D04548F|nr:helix-turn-helix transcriptional regulator [Apilactobacillus micheneri]TPR37185.1 XRE family transcriptional regulator [Apilactobacillus micheneri]TPR39729.1 XRE family transcriptional regulator [Apilactobacillus micheneri]
MALGERLKDIRDDKDISIQELAANTKISADKLYNFEINNEKPNIIQVNKISNYYGIPIDEIANKEDFKDEMKKRYLINNIAFIPLMTAFIWNWQKLFFISYIFLIISGILLNYANHFGKANEIANKLGFENPLAKWIRSKFTRVVSYTLSVALLLAGVLLMIINFDKLGAFGAMFLDVGIVAVLASVMVWDANKN